ncbi:ABC transporter permease [Microbacterium sp. NPDC096154]|uniref:ABC transporter permease n=1 Tax=Microbacterium sp. NPDC096154 TaxID=3155549 RepID=UPI0033252BF2
MTLTQALPRIRPRRKGLGAARSTVLGVGSIVVVLILWELAGRFWANPLFLPPLSAIWTRFLEFAAGGQLATDIAASAQSYLGGLAFAILIGGSVGIAMASSKTIRDVLNPWVSVLNATPTIALAPIFILIFGLGIESKVAVCTLVMIFPILVNTYTGFANTDENLVETIRAFGASHVQSYLKVKLPMALPYLFAALRLAAAHGLVGVVVSELFGAKAGVGLLILNSAHTFDSRGLFAGILMLAIAGVVITYTLIALERRLFRWRRSENGE